MPEDAPRPAPAAIRTALGAIFVSLELSRRTWLITSLSPGAGEKMSKHSVPAGEVSGLLRRFAELRRKAAARTGRDSRLSSSRRSVWKYIRKSGRPIGLTLACVETRGVEPLLLSRRCGRAITFAGRRRGHRLATPT